jgi:hypothetical protein
MSSAAPGALVICSDHGRLQDSRTGLRVVWDSPVLETRERLQLEQLLTRVFREALWEMLEQHSFAYTADQEGGGDDDTS